MSVVYQPLKAPAGRQVYSNTESSHAKAPEGRQALSNSNDYENQ